MERACLWCGQSLKGQRADAVYCNRNCRSAARHAEENGQLRLQAHGPTSGPLTPAARQPGPEPRIGHRSAP